MPSSNTNWALWLIVATVAVLAMFVPLVFMPNWTGIVLGFVVAVVIVLLGLAYQVAYDRRRHAGRRAP